MFRFIGLCFGTLTRLLRARRSLILENLALRQQLAVPKRRHPRPRLDLLDKLFWVAGMLNAVHESQPKIFGRWKIVHDPDRQPIGPVPARGLRSKLRRDCASALQFLGSI